MIEVVYAKAPGQVPLPSGRLVRVPAYSHWPTTDPVVLAAPDLFTSDPRYGMARSEAPPGYDYDLNELGLAVDEVESAAVDVDVEQATAAPGEQRSVRRPGRPRKAASAPADPADAA